MAEYFRGSLAAITAQVAPTTTNAYPKLSKPVVDAAMDSIAALYRAEQSGALASSDVQRAQTTLSILFACMEDSGYNKLLDANAALSAQKMLDDGVDSAHLESILQGLAQAGMAVPEAQARRFFSDAPNDVPAFLDSLRAQGIGSIEQRVVSRLSDLPTRNSGTLSNSDYFFRSARPAHLVLADCAADGLLCDVLALASPPPVDLIMAGAAILYGALGLAGAC